MALSKMTKQSRAASGALQTCVAGRAGPPTIRRGRSRTCVGACWAAGMLADMRPRAPSGLGGGCRGIQADRRCASLKGELPFVGGTVPEAFATACLLHPQILGLGSIAEAVCSWKVDGGLLATAL